MIQRLLDLGIKGFFGGARRGQPLLTGLSAAVAIVAFLRKHRRPDKDLLYGVDLKEGEAIQISFLRGDPVVEAVETED